MKPISLGKWPEHLLAWAEPTMGVMAQSPPRREFKILGELPDRNGKPTDFLIGRSRDEYGSVLHLTPALNHPLLSDPKVSRGWSQWWAKIAVRSGYLSPTIDPGGLALLSRLRLRDSRVDFIVDTNVLIGGVGHWLVRCFGDVCDLVRTVVTDMEVQRFGDALKWVPKDFGQLSDRASYLSASRFLEHSQEQHPVWRRLDIEEETALFVASASKSGTKSPGADTLMLRAVRRSLQDQVPGLVRLFVTSDQNLARAASHDLPVGSTIAAYVNPIPQQGLYLSSVHWWPRLGVDAGHGYMSGLSDFCYEATCLCDAVRLVKADGSFLRISAFVAGLNQFPTDWRGPSVWVEEGTMADRVPQSTKQVTNHKLPPAHPNTLDPDSAHTDGSSSQLFEGQQVKISIPSRSIEREIKNWPFNNVQPVRDNPVNCVARVSGPLLLDLLAAIMLAARESRSVSERVFVGSTDTVRELRNFLRAVDALDHLSVPGPASTDIQEAFANNDTDTLSRMLTKASEYGALIEQLSSSKVSVLDGLNLPKRSATAITGLGRLLGQVVYDNGQLVYGGAFISRDDFIAWFMKTIETTESKGPLGGALLADIACKALVELSISPMRFEKAMLAAIEGSPLSSLDFVAGGTPEKVMEEEVAVLSPRGWTRRKVSADGLLGFRSVRKR